MPSVTLSSLAGGGGLGLRVVSQTSASIASGVTGDILTINAPTANSIVNLYLLVCDIGGSQSGISVIADGDTIVSAGTLDTDGTAQTEGSFRVCRYIGVTTTIKVYKNTLETVRGKTLTINKNAGNTTRVINYAYEILEPIT